MAKEILPPDPVPVSSKKESINDDLYCASFLGHSIYSLSNTSKELLDYLESKYESTYLGGSCITFIANNENIKDIRDKILNLGINGINNKSLDMHVMLTEDYDAVEITLLLY